MKEKIQNTIATVALTIISIACVFILYKYVLIWAIFFMIIPFFFAYWKWGNHKENIWVLILLYGAIWVVPFLGLFHNREVEVWIGSNFIEGFKITNGYEYYQDNETGYGDSEWSDNIPTYPKGSFWGNGTLNTIIIIIEFLWFLAGIKAVVRNKNDKQTASNSPLS